MYVVIVLILVVINGLFAMTEIAVVSSNKFRLQQRAQAGNSAAQKALRLANNPNRFLSTVQIGITLVGVFTGAFGGATIAEPLGASLAQVAWIAPYSDSLALLLVVVFITYLSLVVGELVPKRIGLNNPEGVATALAGFMQGLSVIASPFVWFLGASTSAVMRLLRVRSRDDELISEEEIDMVIAQGRQAGVIEPAEQEIIENAFWLGERRVNAIMTTRTEVSWLKTAASRHEIQALVREEPHGRYLVCENDLDQVFGYAAASDLLAACLAGRPIDLRELSQKPLVVPETLPILSLLERFRSTGIHMAVVFDEFGGFEGLVTLSDILEELVGEVLPAGSAEAPEIVAVDGRTWQVDGRLHVDELLDLLSLEDEVDLETAGFHTVGGLLADHLDRIPAAGDTFIWHGYRFRVEEMDRLRVKRVKVTRTIDPGQSAGNHELT